jgi:hypothetical protein
MGLFVWNFLRHHYPWNDDLITAAVGKAECGCNTGIPTYETNNSARVQD